MYCHFSVLIQAKYVRDEGLGYYNLLKSVDGAKQDGIAVNFKGNPLSISMTSLYRAAEVGIILQQAYLFESNGNK